MHRARHILRGGLAALIPLIALVSAYGQSLYRYQDDQGRWHFSDRKPDEAVDNLQHERRRPGRKPASVTLVQEQDERGLVLVARNDFFCPVQLVYQLNDAQNVPRRFMDKTTVVLPPNGRQDLLVVPLKPGQQTGFGVNYSYLPGEPTATHRPPRPYRAPFAISTTHRITQAYPDQVTHATPGSRHAVDLALPEDTPVYAARAGMVFDVAYDSFTGGTSDEDRAKANVVRIVHDDGTMAVYAHLAWNAIRVRPGTRVRRGEYIANSGNTGYSSGPHLHFAVYRNDNGRLTSVPVTFEGAGGAAVTPASGRELTAY